MNAVSPSMVKTRFLDDIPDLAKEMGAAAAAGGRLALPDEVAGAIQYLLSADGGCLTGIELPIAGGAASA